MSNDSVNNVFNLLPKPVREAIVKIGFSSPTIPQVKTIPRILEGENVLLIAPTGSGKTEAALLPVFSEFIQLPEKGGISILYITPLRALNRDMLRRLSYWAYNLGFSVEVRHGDTEVKIRRRQALKPPDMLVTTPETLQAILPGSLMKRHLSKVRFVIVDEVHEIAESKRGVQLMVALERLLEITDREFQRVGLSATVGNPQKVARFIAGRNRPISVIEVSISKSYHYIIEKPSPENEDYDLAQELKTAPEAIARIRRILNLVNTHTSTLIFVNSRTNAEILGYKISRLSPRIAVHHGSLSREERTSIEDNFKSKKLKGIICTSTLELGVDIGHVDLVVQYLSPRRVTSLIQRVGRSGHKLGLVSQGVIITAFNEDALESLASVKLAYQNSLEPIAIHENALDVLAHQIAGILMDQGEITVERAFKMIRRAYPYRQLSKVKFLDVVNYLNDLGELRREGDLLKRTRRTRHYYYENLSMIPDEKRYPIIDVLTDRRIGTLGDEFMALRARIGLSFICKGKVWRIVQIEDETGKVYVVPSDDPMAAVPGWDGEMLPVSFSIAQEVGKLRWEIVEELKSESNIEKITKHLAKRFSTQKSVLLEIVMEVNEHLKQGLPVPTHNNILIEGFDRYIILHACFGEIVNKTLGCVFDAVLSDKEMITGWWNDAYRILIEMPRKVHEGDLKMLSSLLFSMIEEEVEKAFDAYLEARFPFAYKMKSIAERFGVLPRGKTMGPSRLEQLPERLRDTPIYDETIREVMVEKVDLALVKRIMRSIKAGKVKVSVIGRLEKPTPIACHILSKYSEIPELMAPRQVLVSNIERMKRSISSRKVQLLCLSCGSWSVQIRVRDVSEKPVCGKCGSGLLASLKRGVTPEEIMNILKRRLGGERLSEEEIKALTYARRVADLVLSYGKKALIALQVKGVGPETASRILGKMHFDEKELYMDLLQAKIRFLRTRQYWEDR